MSKKDRILRALAIAVTLVAIFIIGITISVLLWRLPSPWGVVSNIGFVFLVLVAMVYLDLGKNEKKMTKYYFISYVFCDGDTKGYGHCLMSADSPTLKVILKEIQRHHGFKTLLTILCLKDLSKEEYEMLKGGSEHGED